MKAGDVRKDWKVDGVLIRARTENEARKIKAKRDARVPVKKAAKDTGHRETPRPTKPGASTGRAPAVQATPENIKALAKEAMGEYIRDGLEALMRGLLGGR